MKETVVLLRKPKRYVWAPQPDITAYELASCLTVVMTSLNGDAALVEAAYVLLPESAKRHWQIEDDGSVAQYA